MSSGTLTVIDRSDAGRTEDLAWSPDGAWLAYSFWTSPRHCTIKLHDTGRETSILVTKPEFRDYSPAFDPQGRYLYFLSVRTFDPVYDSVQFELSFPRAARPYLIALQAGGRPPFDPLPRGLKPEGLKPEDPRAAHGPFERLLVRSLRRIAHALGGLRHARKFGALFFGIELRASHDCRHRQAIRGRQALRT
jgi:tricorn protease